MARRATFINQQRTQSPNVLLLDSGDDLFSSQPLAKSTAGKIVVEAMNRLGYDAMTLGDDDLQLGAKVLQARMSDAKFPFLSANVVLASNGQLFAKPYVIRMVAGRSVGIIGLTNAQQASIGDFSITDPVEAARKVMAEVRQQTNVVIVLSHLGLQQDEMLAVTVPGIALIVGGHSRTLLIAPRKQEGSPTLIVQAGYQGEFIGRVQLHIASDGKVADSTATVIPLTTDFADDPAMKAWLDGRRQAP